MEFKRCEVMGMQRRKEIVLSSKVCEGESQSASQAEVGAAETVAERVGGGRVLWGLIPMFYGGGEEE